jgi:hypothetical protein
MNAMTVLVLPVVASKFKIQKNAMNVLVLASNAGIRER